MRRIAWRTVALVLVLLLPVPNLAETDEKPRDWVDTLDLGFEQDGTKWYLGGKGYVVTVVDDEKHSGERALRMTCEELGSFGVATGGFPVEEARGKRLRLTGYVKTAEITKGWAGLWMRIDGPDGSLGFDNMQRRGITGTTDWTQYEIVLEVPGEAKAVVFGALLTGDGTAWIDSLEFEVLETVPAVMVSVSGVAADPDGAPVAGAHVAFVVPMTDGAAARTVTDDAGRYRVEIESGEYAITVNRAGLTAYIEPRTFGPEETSAAYDIAMSADGVTITGRVTDEADRPVGGVPLKVYRLSEDVADIFYTETDDDGRYAATLPEGEGYVAWLDSDDYIGEPAQVGA
ncbi:MAG: carboxypeptidase-like regulatory domain-containing protein, partial [Acidobacteriota bacterium]|nr:carboxypeptidase-like regulatory domain-containing protein [Acidobacteriota bacterium]